MEKINYGPILKQLMERIKEAEKQHPHTPFDALVSEVGEVANARHLWQWQSGGRARVNDELLDVAAVAIRIIAQDHCGDSYQIGDENAVAN